MANAFQKHNHNRRPSDSTVAVEFEMVSKETRQKVLAFKHYFKRYRIDLFQYIYCRTQRKSYLENQISGMFEEDEFEDENYTEFMKNRKPLSEDEANILRNQLNARESAYLRKRRTRMKVKDFQLLSLIGRGGYGEVYLARRVEGGEILVLKRMKKSLYLNKNMAVRAKREKEILSQSDSPWIIKLMYSFQDEEHLYLAMEYAGGGDLKTLLENLGRLDEKDAKFYFAEMVLCVEYLHSLGFVHRDLKPGNFVIDKLGHLKLIDFGLSKDGIESRFKETIKRWSRILMADNQALGRSRGSLSAPLQDTFNQNKEGGYRVKRGWGMAYSKVGSPEYMAPEILSGEGYDGVVDAWALGCCLYEMLVGNTPFSADTPEHIFANILHWKDNGGLERPISMGEDENGVSMSDAAWDLITKLLCEPDKRLGRNGVEEIKSHPFLKDIDWVNIREQEPAFLPRLENECDTSYFNTTEVTIDENSIGVIERGLEEEITEATKLMGIVENMPGTPASPRLRKHNTDMIFAGFTFKRFDMYS